MREILFKAKRIDTGEWVEGYIHKCEGKFVISNNDGLGEFINADTICQYTGLTDKNGHKIWENDVVKYHFGNDVAPIKFGEYQSCFDSIKAGHIGFYLDWDCKKALRKDLGYWVNIIDCNVVANLFDHRELLEEVWNEKR